MNGRARSRSGVVLAGLLAGLAFAGACRDDEAGPATASGSVALRVQEGTGLTFDLTPDGQRIILDVLGQLWSIPVEGGPARPLTDAIRDTADDSEPFVSPDGRWVLFHSDRPAGRGLWLLSLRDGDLRQLTDSAIFANDEHRPGGWSPDSRQVLYVRGGRLHVIDTATMRDSLLAPEGMPQGFVSTPAWSRDGTRILFRSGRLWAIDLNAGRAAAFDADTSRMYGAVPAPDGDRVAYFSDPGGSEPVQLRVRRRGNPDFRVVAMADDMAPFRVRWSPDGRALYYVADGGLWRVSPDVGPPTRIPFTVAHEVPRPSWPSRAVRLPAPGTKILARGFAGLAIAPDARRYALIATGRLWLADVGGAPREITSVPSTASGLSWSPDGDEVAWSAGREGAEDLFATNVRTGATRQLTSLPGAESMAAWSPDGRFVAFAHWAKPASADPPWAPDTVGVRVRVMRSDLHGAATKADTRDLGRFAPNGAGNDRLSWDPASSAVLVYGTPGWPVSSRDPAQAVWLGLDGGRRETSWFPFRPSFVHVGRDGSFTWVEDGRLLREPSGASEPEVMGSAAALHPSVADDGTVLFASGDGLRVRKPDGTETLLGWPVAIDVPPPPAPLIIRNVRVFDGTGAAPIDNLDMLIEGGRIRALEPAGRIPGNAGTEELDAGGRTAIPGLIDGHTHVDRTSLLAALYFGVTTTREMGSGLARAAALRDAILSGAMPGPRVIVSGLRFYPSPTTGGLTGDMEWMPRDTSTMRRGLDLVEAFGGGHIKLRFPLTEYNGAAFVRMARSRGFTVSGHCADPLPLIVAGISGQEHLDGQCGARSAARAYADRFELYRTAGLWGVPTIFLHAAHARAAADTAIAHAADTAPFMTARGRLDLLSDAPGGRLPFLRLRQGEDAREGTRRAHEAGLPIALGTDAPGFPDAVHGELEELVEAGLTPADAIRAATQNAARMLRVDADVGVLAPGMIADVLLLDGDPFLDVRNTRRIWRIIQSGRILDRDAVRDFASSNR